MKPRNYLYCCICLVSFFLFFGSVSAADPIVKSITPGTGVNTTSVTITGIAGNFFATGATVMLTPVNLRPVHKGSLFNGAGGALLTQPLGLAKSWNYVYLASEKSNALEIVDISDPANPAHKGSLVNGQGGALLHYPRDVFVSGNYAYVVSFYSNALEIVDISDPANPVHKGSLVNGQGGALLGTPISLKVSGKYAYITSNYSNALEIVDISDPANPVHKGSLVNGQGGALLLDPGDVFVSGNYAYVASNNSNALEIVNISDPAHPVHEGSLVNGQGGALLDFPKGVVVSGNYAYVTGGISDALEIVDISDPAHPVHKGSLVDGQGGALLNRPEGLVVSGNYAFVTVYFNNALEIVDVSDPAHPVHKGSLVNGAGGALLSGPARLTVSGKYAYVASYMNSALEIVDMGTVSGTGVNVASPTQINACTFDLTSVIAGFYNVVVTNPDGSFGVLPGGFEVTAPGPEPIPAPTVTGITPASGVNTTSISITHLAGTDFNTTATPVAVKLSRTGHADIVATSVTVVDSTKITCAFDLAGQEIGLWNVVVTNPDGQFGVLPGGFEVTAPTTTILISFTPTLGGTGTSVTITGTNFIGATAVRFGGTDAKSFAVDSATQITAVVGDGSTGNVVVITAGGTATSASIFTYITTTPVPTLNEGGLIVLSLLIIGAGYITIRRRKSASV